MPPQFVRCPWAAAGSPAEKEYHDKEWGVPVHDDRLLFEFLILGGAQAGLSWSTILNKRNGYRSAFDNFDAHKIACYDNMKIDKLKKNLQIVRNRLKIESAVSNARAFLVIQSEFGSFDNYIWQFVDRKPVINHWKSMDELPAVTPSSESMSKDMKKRGFRFVGPTICYAFMQAVGMVNDHIVDCFRYKAICRAS